MPKGTLLWFSPETGYGLICPDEGRRNIFVRPMAIAAANDLEALEKGAKVTYEVDQGRNGMRAKNVRKVEHPYSWREDSRERHEGKEARHEYYAGL